MNGGSRHMQYRRRLQRKRRIRRILLTVGILLVLLLAGFLILGNLLAREEEPSAPETGSESGETPSETLPAAVKAYPVYFETSDDSSLSSRLQALRGRSATDASILMNRTDGALLYSSALADSLGSGAVGYSTTVERAASLAKSHGVGLCGVWHLTAFSEKDPLIRSVRLSETATILADALSHGMTDILLMAPGLSPDSSEELLLLSENVHRLCPDGALGLCIPSSFFEAENSSVLVDDLVKGFDFLAVNATELQPEQAATERVSAVASEHLDLLLRYQMRLLLPYSADEAEQAAIVAAAEQYSVKSWQILPWDP